MWVSLQIHVPRDELAANVHPDRLRVADLSACLFQRGDHVLTTVTEPGITGEGRENVFPAVRAVSTRSDSVRIPFAAAL